MPCSCRQGIAFTYTHKMVCGFSHIFQGFTSVFDNVFVISIILTRV
uniref:Uncharacterized protein n=1 Tax=Anguilla anguilla TaxID=7936 RepID=A0A0E9QJT7_ANGAN